ncbi:MAG TPA: ABC transporter permease [Actinomycetota bacterium]|jgi:spermidine/putrescine transport system permease protein
MSSLPAIAGPQRSFTSRARDALSNPWGRTRFLWVVGIGYVLWSLVPVVNAVVFSFNRARSITQWGGFSLRWYITDPNESVLHDPNLRHAILQSFTLALLTVVIAVPFGVAFAIALRHWRGRSSGTSNFLMMFSFVTPELILAVALFLLFIDAFRVFGLGTFAQAMGLVVLALAYPVVIVRARLLSIGATYEEAAMDLGASPMRTLGRVTLPMLAPSIFASAAIIFVFTLDDFVVVNQLARDSSNETVAMAIYGAARTAPTPATNAVGTLMLVASTIVVTVTVMLYRRAGRRRGDIESP